MPVADSVLLLYFYKFLCRPTNQKDKEISIHTRFTTVLKIWSWTRCRPCDMDYANERNYANAQSPVRKNCCSHIKRNKMRTKLRTIITSAFLWFQLFINSRYLCAKKLGTPTNRALPMKSPFCRSRLGPDALLQSNADSSAWIAPLGRCELHTPQLYFGIVK